MDFELTNQDGRILADSYKHLFDTDEPLTDLDDEEDLYEQAFGLDEPLTDLEEEVEPVNGKGTKPNLGKMKQVHLSIPDQIASGNLSPESEEKILRGFFRQDKKSIDAARMARGSRSTSLQFRVEY